jgi:hypothetical protein
VRVNGAKDALTCDGQIQPQTLNIIPLVSVLAKAMQEQQRTIQQQQQTLRQQQQEIEQLETMVRQLAQGGAKIG